MQRFVHYLYLIPLMLAALYSLTVFGRGWAKPYKMFSLFLLLTLGMETFAICWKLFLYHTAYWGFSRSNLWIYNLYIVPEYLFYLWFFANLLESRRIKRYALGFAILYFLFCLFNITFLQSFFQLNTYSIIFGAALVLYMTVFYFLQELNRKMPVKVEKDPLFWISLGAFIFHSVSLPYFIFINYLSRTNISLAIALFNILLALNVLMYLFYLIAFTCNSRFRKRSC